VTPVPDVATSAPPVFEAERLLKRPYWTAGESAFMLGYDRPKYKNPRGAFNAFVRRNGIRPGYPRGARVRRPMYRQSDIAPFLDRGPA